MHARGRVYVIGATNRPDQLDPALLRAGRLSRVIEIPVPGRAARGQLLALFTRRMPMDGVDLDALAERTEGWSGADLEALCQQAAVRAMVTAGAGERPEITAEDFEYALSTLTAARSRDRPGPGRQPADIGPAARPDREGGLTCPASSASRCSSCSAGR